MNALRFFVLVACVFVASGTEKRIPGFLKPGRCPHIPESQLWQMQKPRHAELGGTWYQHSLTPNKFQTLEKCVHIRYVFDGEAFQVMATGLDKAGTPKITQGKIYPSGSDPHFMIAQEHSTPAPLTVLDTDYMNYACLYSCMDFGGKHFTDFAFVFSRTPELNEAYARACSTTFTNIGIESSRFYPTHQGWGCPYDALRALEQK